MKIAYLTAGAAGMFCGSCMHDNTLARALIARAFAQHAAQAQDEEHGNDAEEDQIQILKTAAHGSPDQFRAMGGHLGDSRLAGPRRVVALDGGR